MIQELSIIGEPRNGKPSDQEFRVQFDHEENSLYFFIGRIDEVTGKGIPVSIEDAKDILSSALVLINQL